MTQELLENLLFNVEKRLIGQKEVMTFDEVATYTGLSKSYLYKLTSAGEIAHFKPKGKLLFFNRSDVEAFLMQNRVSNREELETKAVNFINQKQGSKKG